jgi:Transposase DDE domain
MESKPIPLCLPIRHGRVRVLCDEGADFGKTRTGWFFGFNLHRLPHGQGWGLNVLLTPGNWDDRPATLALVQGVEGE